MKKLLTIAFLLLLSSAAVKSYAQSTFNISNAAYYVDSVRINTSAGTIVLSPWDTYQPITVADGPCSLEFFFNNNGNLGMKVRTTVTSDWYSPSTSDIEEDHYTRVAVVSAYPGEGWYYSFQVIGI